MKVVDSKNEKRVDRKQIFNFFTLSNFLEIIEKKSKKEKYTFDDLANTSSSEDEKERTESVYEEKSVLLGSFKFLH
jgi:hypothetical protein